MTCYSHSRISTFENCPYQYKLRYIDRIKPEIPDTIEAFMGSVVHEVLEWLYKQIRFEKEVSKDLLLERFNEIWDKGYSEDILIVKKELTAENYKKMGRKFVSNYYDRYAPFNQLKILGLETQDRMTLPDGNQWHVRIDKFACDDEGNYYVCDYKTNSRMKDQEEADSDRQLAMYSIWVKDKFKDAKSVKLVWHMLAFDKDVTSERSDEQLKKLQEEIVEKIKEIENAREFPTNVTGLCNYCGYKNMCPSFKHEVQLDLKSSEEFKKDEGLKMVDDYAKIKNKLAELRKKEDELKGRLAAFAKQFDLDTIYGSNMKCSVKGFDKFVMPADSEEKEKFIQLMKDKGIYEECSMICYPRLNSRFVKGDVDEELKKWGKIEKDFRLSLSKRKDVEE